MNSAHSQYGNRGFTAKRNAPSIIPMIRDTVENALILPLIFKNSSSLFNSFNVSYKSAVFAPDLNENSNPLNNPANTMTKNPPSENPSKSAKHNMKALATETVHFLPMESARTPVGNSVVIIARDVIASYNPMSLNVNPKNRKKRMYIAFMRPKLNSISDSAIFQIFDSNVSDGF